MKWAKDDTGASATCNRKLTNQIKKKKKILNHNRNYAYHGVNFIVELRMFEHSDKERSTSQRVSDVRHFRLASFFQDVIDDGWQVVIPNFVPANGITNLKTKQNKKYDLIHSNHGNQVLLHNT